MYLASWHEDAYCPLLKIFTEGVKYNKSVHLGNAIFMPHPANCSISR